NVVLKFQNNRRRTFGDLSVCFLPRHNGSSELTIIFSYPHLKSVPGVPHFSLEDVNFKPPFFSFTGFPRALCSITS
ncbi:unnamed protein product, partial [Larinioides sclopetarius]